jgi:hypothetical protein
VEKEMAQLSTVPVSPSLPFPFSMNS